MMNTSIYEEISSSEEETILNESFTKLVLQLEKDLERLKKDINGELNIHFKELKVLKKIATFSVIRLENVTEFLETAIFTLMIEVPESFSFESITLYKCMLKNVESFPERAYKEHVQVLLNLKNDEIKDLLLLIHKERKEKQQQSFSLFKKNEQKVSVVRPFFSILSEEKAKKRTDSDNAEIKCGEKRLRKISPLTLPNNSM